MKETLKFLKELRINNNREWFNENKQRYNEARGRVESLTLRLLAALSEIEPECGRMAPADCMYRIYRDTRFSPDKTPYKNHIGVYMNPHGGKKSILGGFYLHLEPGNCLVAGGIWCPPASVLKALRQDIFDNVEEYLEIINAPEFGKYIDQVGEDCLKTVPKGFPKDWEHIELLRPRSFTVYSKFSDAEVCKTGFENEVMRRFRVIKPYNDFINYSFEEHPDIPKFF